jgi:hypothetical protein
MTPLSIQDQIQKFRSIDKQEKQKPHRYMEMSEEGVGDGHKGPLNN